jgi:fermentation-respiration switch protein FrsA (DUF1100 family)
MELNNFVFPAPKLQWDVSSFPGQLLWLPVKPSSVGFEELNQQIDRRVEKVGPAHQGTFPGRLKDPIDKDIHLFVSGLRDYYLRKQHEHHLRVFPEDACSELSGGQPLTSFGKPAPGCVACDLSDDEAQEQGNLRDAGPSGINAGAGLGGPRKAPARGAYDAAPEHIDHFCDSLVERYVPALLLVPEIRSHKLIIYFHANAEDVGQAETLCRSLNSKLEVAAADQCYFLLVEYPGYSLYPGEASEANILADLEHVWNFVHAVCGFEPQDVFAMGRSIGSGPAVEFATRFPIGGLVLVSPFASIQDVASHNYLSLLSYFIKQRFDNSAKITAVRCPCLFIHGKEDALVPFQHSKQLYELCSRPAEIQIFSGMSHHKFDVIECVAMPALKFIEKIDNRWVRPLKFVTFPKFCFALPRKQAQQILDWVDDRFDVRAQR